MNSESYSRLLILADYLENCVPDSEFDLENWKCGSVACAVGHACSIPEFKRLGLHMSFDPAEVYYPVFGNSLRWSAVDDFFELTVDESQYLFAAGSYLWPTTQFDISRRIRDFVVSRKLPKKESLGFSFKKALDAFQGESIEPDQCELVPTESVI